MEDSYRHKGMRRRLIAQLKAKGIHQNNVLDAMAMLPRHYFLEKAFEEWAYEDKAFPIGVAQTISQPYTVAYQTTLLDVQKGDKILEIGTGSGYQAAILALLGAEVHSVERYLVLHQKATALLHQLHIPNICTYHHDGSVGLPAVAPFDKILVTAAAETLPTALLMQLKIGGTLVVPIGNGDTQKMYKILKISDKEYEETIYDEFRFVPFLSGTVQ